MLGLAKLSGPRSSATALSLCGSVILVLLVLAWELGLTWASHWSCTRITAELIAGLGPRGQFSSGYTNLADLAVEMTNAAESHHFYSALFYFRFRDLRCSVSRISLVTFDTVTLIKSALDDERYGWLKETASVAQLWHVSMLLVTKLEATFLPSGVPARALHGLRDG